MTTADDEPIIWMRPENPGKGPAPKHSRAEIAAAAVAIADAEGIGAVSMRKVAAKIGAGTMSLYRYVHNKDELYSLMVDAILAPDIPEELRRPSPPVDLAGLLRDFALSVRGLVLAHPWFPELQAGIPAPSPNMARGMEFMLAAMDGAAPGMDAKLEVLGTVMTYAIGATRDDLAESQAIFRSGLDREQWMKRQAPYWWSLIETGEFPHLYRVIVDAKIPHEDRDAVFERSLNRIITGIVATLDIDHG